MKLRVTCIVTAVSIIFLSCLSVVESNKKSSNILEVINNSGNDFFVFLIGTETDNFRVKKLSKTPIADNSSIVIHADKGTRYLIKHSHAITAMETHHTKGNTNEKLYVTFDSTAQRLLATVNRDWSVTDDLSVAIRECVSSQEGHYIKNISGCTVDSIGEEVNSKFERNRNITRFLNQTSLRLRNYICADDDLPTSPPVYSHTVPYAGVDHQVNVLLPRKTSLIWTVDDFVSADECSLIRAISSSKLKRSLMPTHEGVYHAMDARKASHSLLRPNLNSTTDPLRLLYKKIIGFTSMLTGFDLSEEGQEDFSVIQYKEGDQYLPHCDGACDGSVHKKGGRAASAILYCHAPERGGVTTFTNADIYVRPKTGTALFFTYKDREGRMDDGFTEHSSCPVTQGEKWVVSLYMRDGVTGESPGSKLDPKGVPHFSAHETLLFTWAFYSYLVPLNEMMRDYVPFLHKVCDNVGQWVVKPILLLMVPLIVV